MLKEIIQLIKTVALRSYTLQGSGKSLILFQNGKGRILLPFFAGKQKSFFTFPDHEARLAA